MRVRTGIDGFIALQQAAAQQNFTSLTRISATPSRIADLTCCRALFAAWVFAYHLNLHARFASALGMVAPLVTRGYLGVDGFFVLSGLILAHAHRDLGLAPSVAMRFWLRRLVRIYPVHLAMIGLLAVLLLCGLALGHPPRQPQRFGLGELARHLLLVQGWGVSDRWAWNYPSWSISTEWAGYLAFPLLWAMLRRTPAGLAALLPPVALAALLAVDLRSGAGLNLTFQGALLRFFPEFLAGMAITRLIGPHAHAGRSRGLAAGGLVLAVMACMARQDALAVAGLWLFLAGLRCAAAHPLLAPIPGLAWLGRLSYAFYMSFAIVEMIAAAAWRGLGIAPSAAPLPYVAASTATTLALALAIHRLIERPAIRRFSPAV